MSESRHPKTYAQAQMFAAIFRFAARMPSAFRHQALEPRDVMNPRLTPGQYEKILTWFEKGMPKMTTVLSQK